MLCFQAISWIRWMANQVRRPKTGLFSTSIDAVVTLSITVGMAVVLIAVMVMLGFQKEIRKKITAFAGDFEITSRNNRHSPYELAPLQAEQVSRLMADLPSFIEKVTPFTQKIMLMHAKGGVEALLCKGIDAMVADKALADYLILGRLPAVGNLVYPRELCISHDLAQQLSIQLGDNVVVHTLHPTVRYRKLKVVGIYCTYLKDIDQNLAFCDRRLIQRLNNWSPETVNGYTIFLKDDVSPTNALKGAILPLIDQDLVLVSTRRKYASFYDWLLILQKNTAIFILFILLIAGFTMVATVMIQLMERSYMIGILKVLGAYDWQVHAILLYNGLRTLCFGMVYGNIIGMGLCFLQARYRCITLEPALYYMRYVPIYINWQTIASLNLLIISVLVVALYMAIKLLKQQKLVEALADH